MGPGRDYRVPGATGGSELTVREATIGRSALGDAIAPGRAAFSASMARGTLRRQGGALAHSWPFRTHFECRRANGMQTVRFRVHTGGPTRCCINLGATH